MYPNPDTYSHIGHFLDDILLDTPHDTSISISSHQWYSLDSEERFIYSLKYSVKEVNGQVVVRK